MTDSDRSPARPLPRPANLRRAPLTFRICMVAVAFGIAGIVTAAVLYASHQDVPWWLWIVAALLPIGFAVGAVSIKSAAAAVGGRPPRRGPAGQDDESE